MQQLASKTPFYRPGQPTLDATPSWRRFAAHRHRRARARCQPRAGGRTRLEQQPPRLHPWLWRVPVLGHSGRSRRRARPGRPGASRPAATHLLRPTAAGRAGLGGCEHAPARVRPPHSCGFWAADLPLQGLWRDRLVESLAARGVRTAARLAAAAGLEGVHESARGSSSTATCVDRLQTLAPFLRWDPNPAALIVRGRIVFLAAGYTVSDSYPYAQRITVAGSNARYARPAVQATVDAYSGRVRLYATDRQRADPPRLGCRFPWTVRADLTDAQRVSVTACAIHPPCSTRRPTSTSSST